MLTKKVLQPAVFAKPANFSLGIEATGGKMIFVAGMVSTDEKGKTVGVGDIKAQTRQVLANIEKVLAEAGATRDNIMKITVYLTDLKNFGGMAEVRGEFFKAPYPTSAAVQAQLVNPEWLVEIECIAMI